MVPNKSTAANFFIFLLTSMKVVIAGHFWTFGSTTIVMVTHCIHNTQVTGIIFRFSVPPP